MSTPNLAIAGNRQTLKTRERSVSLLYNRVIGAVVQLLQESPRDRFGKVKYPEFCVKTEGFTELNTIGDTNAVNGGLLYESPDTTLSNRSREIYAAGNIVYLYDVVNDTRVLLRDIGTLDSLTISFLSGVQAKNNAYFVIGDSTASSILYKYEGTTSGVITAFADYSGTVAGTVLVTDATHGLETGNSVTIIGTTSYNGTFEITKVDANSFYITDTWVANDATGTWTGETLTQETATGMNAGRLISVLDDRLMVTGVGSNNAKVQYSYISTSADFSNFTASTNRDEGGLLSGSLNSVTALVNIKGIGVVAEEKRITFHTIGTYDVSGTGRLKDPITLNENQTIDGVGVTSPKAMTVANDAIYLSSQTGILEIDPVTGKVRDLTAPFRPLMEDYDFSDASVEYDEKRKQLYVTCSSVNGIGADRIFIYNFETKSWSIDEGKRVNQLHYDPITKKVIGLSSNSGAILDVFDGAYTNDDETILLSCETSPNDMGNEMRNKRYVSTSVNVGAVSTTQSFTFEWFVNDNASPSVTVTKTVAELVASSGSLGTAWGGSTWAGGSPSSTKLGFLKYEHTFFVPDFEKISLRVTENSSLRSAVGSVVIRFSESTDTINDFS